MQITLTNEQQAMLFRLLTSYQATLSTTLPLNQHQIAWVSYLLNVLPQVTPVPAGDRLSQSQLLGQIAQYYRESTGMA